MNTKTIQAYRHSRISLAECIRDSLVYTEPGNHVSYRMSGFGYQVFLTDKAVDKTRPDFQTRCRGAYPAPLTSSDDTKVGSLFFFFSCFWSLRTCLASLLASFFATFFSLLALFLALSCRPKSLLAPRRTFPGFQTLRTTVATNMGVASKT